MIGPSICSNQPATAPVGVRQGFEQMRSPCSAPYLRFRPIHPARGEAIANEKSRRLAITSKLTEASNRFRLPVHWLRAVMRAESGGDAKSVSSKGAIGLMQLMPATYAELRTRYGLGAHPFDPHDNIQAGGAYLRELLDHYGEHGFLAASNAGPGRYGDYMRDRPLAAERPEYAQRIASALSFGANSAAPYATSSGNRASPMFVTISSPKGTTISRRDTAPTQLSELKDRRGALSFRRGQASEYLQYICRQRAAPTLRRLLLCRAPMTFSRFAGLQEHPDDSSLQFSQIGACPRSFVREPRRGSASDRVIAR